jgi:hypothetical protein
VPGDLPGHVDRHTGIGQGEPLLVNERHLPALLIFGSQFGEPMPSYPPSTHDDAVEAPGEHLGNIRA